MLQVKVPVICSLEEAQRWADALCDRAVPVRVNPANSWKSQLLDFDLELIVKARLRRSWRSIAI